MLFPYQRTLEEKCVTVACSFPSDAHFTPKLTVKAFLKYMGALEEAFLLTGIHSTYVCGIRPKSFAVSMKMHS